MFIKSKPARKKQKIIFIFLATIFALSFFVFLIPQNSLAAPVDEDPARDIIRGGMNPDAPPSAGETQALKTACDKAGGTITSDGYNCEKGGKALSSEELYKNSSSSANPSGSTAAATAAGNDIFSQLIDILQKLIIAAAFLMFILAIFTYVGSGGDSKKVGKAKEYLVSAITALVALVLAQWFLKFK